MSLVSMSGEELDPFDVYNRDQLDLPTLDNLKEQQQTQRVLQEQKVATWVWATIDGRDFSFYEWADEIGPERYSD